MARFPWQKAEAQEGQAEFTFPDELAKQIKDGAEAAGKVSKLEEAINSMKDIMVADKTERETARRAAEEVARRVKTQETSEQTEEQIAELILTDPAAAIRLATQGQTQAIKAVHADAVRREVFEDQDKFKYYTGDVKTQVDALLAQQSVDFRLNPVNIANTYYTVIGQHNDKIVEGKLKTRFAGGTGGGGNSGGSTGGSGGGGDKKFEITGEYKKEIERAARQSSIPYDEYVKMLDAEGVL